MFLPSRLRDTTLGDLLATLHRAYASGVLELIDTTRRYVIHLRRGLVQAMECELAGTRFGDVASARGLCDRMAIERASHDARVRGVRIGQALLGAGRITSRERDAVLDAQRALRLDVLHGLADAELRFYAARSLPTGAAEQRPLDANVTYHGRPRRRTRGVSPLQSERARALAVLGLGIDASSDEIRTRYRAKVVALHPDRASHEANEHALRAVIEAYRSLTSARHERM
jgi:hypothetical protein